MKTILKSLQSGIRTKWYVFCQCAKLHESALLLWCSTCISVIGLVGLPWITMASAGIRSFHLHGVPNVRYCMSDKMAADLIESSAVLTKVHMRGMVQKGQAKTPRKQSNDMKTK